MADARIDITSLIMDDHEWFRRQFAALDDADGPEELAAVWEPLATRLDTHAQAEETVFYPALLKKGDEEDAEEETDDAIRDHNKIKDAVADARKEAGRQRRVVRGGRPGARGEHRAPRRGGGRGAAGLPQARELGAAHAAGRALAGVLRAAPGRQGHPHRRRRPRAVHRREQLSSSERASRRAASARSAWPRWLIASFSSLGNSALVTSSPSGHEDRVVAEAIGASRLANQPARHPPVDHELGRAVDVRDGADERRAEPLVRERRRAGPGRAAGSPRRRRVRPPSGPTARPACR